MVKRFASLSIGLGIPVVLIFGGIIVFRQNDNLIAGFPVIFAWMIACFPLTSACLLASWWFFDRHLDPIGDDGC